MFSASLNKTQYEKYAIGSFISYYSICSHWITKYRQRTDTLNVIYFSYSLQTKINIIFKKSIPENNYIFLLFLKTPNAEFSVLMSKSQSHTAQVYSAWADIIQNAYCLTSNGRLFYYISVVCLFLFVFGHSTLTIRFTKFIHHLLNMCHLE